jgi:hypothetical protein
MTLPRWTAISTYLADNPPLPVLVKGLVGFETKGVREAPLSTSAPRTKPEGADDEKAFTAFLEQFAVVTK